MEKFDKWVASKGLKKQFVAEQVGIGRVYLWKVMQGKEKPSAALIANIAEFTNGVITSADWPE